MYLLGSPANQPWWVSPGTDGGGGVCGGGRIIPLHGSTGLSHTHPLQEPVALLRPLPPPTEAPHELQQAAWESPPHPQLLGISVVICVPRRPRSPPLLWDLQPYTGSSGTFRRGSGSPSSPWCRTRAPSPGAPQNLQGNLACYAPERGLPPLQQVWLSIFREGEREGGEGVEGGPFFGASQGPPVPRSRRGLCRSGSGTLPISLKVPLGLCMAPAYTTGSTTLAGS